VLEEADQQVKLWLQLAHEAYSDRQMVRALHYFQRALDYAQEKGHDLDVALVCRDMGYVCAREGSLNEALGYFDQGLAITGVELSVRTGLMANKASVLVSVGAYRPALELLEESSDLIRSQYDDFSDAPSQLVHSYAAIVQMADGVRKVVDLLDMGVRADRIQVDIKRYDPPWLLKNE
jgi:tetratricopeptide (TPR) repeat protein